MTELDLVVYLCSNQQSQRDGFSPRPCLGHVFVVGEISEGVGVGDIEGDKIREKKYKMKLEAEMSSLNPALAFGACGYTWGLVCRSCNPGVEEQPPASPTPSLTTILFKRKFGLNKILFYTCPCKISLITQCFCSVKLFIFKRCLQLLHLFENICFLTLCSIASPFITPLKPSFQSLRWPPNYELVWFLLQLIFLSSSFLRFHTLTLSTFLKLTLPLDSD